MTACSCNTLKHIVSAPSADHSANIPWVTHAEQEGLVSPEGAGSPTQASMGARENGLERADGMSVPQGMNAYLLGAAPHARDGTGVTDSLRETGSCAGMEGAVGGINSAANSTLYSAQPRGYPVGQSKVFRDLSSGMVTANLGSHSLVSNLFSLPAPAYAGAVPTGASSNAPTAAARTRSAPVARERVGQIPLFEINVWLTMKPDLSRRARFHQS